ncbi:MAG: hypothetical protein Ct9H300mP1_01510 [Planctomycetaceae bacterium]|nr:MAG: hypothetical protein Ct9H300mP1_01510 [Planctomycetaceae bacterium]
MIASTSRSPSPARSIDQVIGSIPKNCCIWASPRPRAYVGDRWRHRLTDGRPSSGPTGRSVPGPRESTESLIVGCLGNRSRRPREKRVSSLIGGISHTSTASVPWPRAPPGRNVDDRPGWTGCSTPSSITLPSPSRRNTVRCPPCGMLTRPIDVDSMAQAASPRSRSWRLNSRCRHPQVLPSVRLSPLPNQHPPVVLPSLPLLSLLRSLGCLVHLFHLDQRRPLHSPPGPANPSSIPREPRSNFGTPPQAPSA